MLLAMARKKQDCRLKTNSPTRDPRLKSSHLKGKAREDIKAEIKQDIQNELYAWVIMQPKQRFEQLPPDSGMCLLSLIASPPF